MWPHRKYNLLWRRASRHTPSVLFTTQPPKMPPICNSLNKIRVSFFFGYFYYSLKFLIGHRPDLPSLDPLFPIPLHRNHHPALFYPNAFASYARAQLYAGARAGLYTGGLNAHYYTLYGLLYPVGVLAHNLVDYDDFSSFHASSHVPLV